MIKDLQYTLRSLAKSPLFVVVSVLTLGFGIGVNTTVFSLVSSLLLRPLPVEDPDRLVEVYTVGSDKIASSSSYPDYLDLRQDDEALSGLAGYSMMFAAFDVDGRSQVVVGELATGNYWQVLGIEPARGRFFGPEDNQSAGAHPVAVVSHSFWQSKLQGRSDVVGSTLRLNGREYDVLGVAPEAFTGLVPGLAADLWLPAVMATEVEPVGRITSVASPGSNRIERRGMRWMFMKGRLKEGVSPAQAQSRLGSIMAGLEESYASNKDQTVQVVPAGRVRFHPDLDNTLSTAAGVLMGLVGMVLLIACANLANMMLSRATSRTREISIRLALGAGRGALIRQLLLESVVIALLGAAAAAILAYWTLGLLVTYQPPIPLAVTLDVAFDWRVLGFNTLLALGSALFFGLAPALQASRPNIVESLKQGGRTAGASQRLFSARGALVTLQIVVSTTLLIVAGLMFRGLLAAHSVPVGLEPDRVAVLSLHLGNHGYDVERGEIFYKRLLDETARLPGVESVALATRLPFSLNVHAQRIFLPEDGRGAEDPGQTVDSTAVGPGYFATLGVALSQGRVITADDTTDTGRVAVINQTLAERLWPDEPAVGKRIRLRRWDGPEAEIVGVVANHKVRTVGESDRPMLHLARRQEPSVVANLVLRSTAGSAAPLVQAARQATLRLDPELAFMSESTLDEMMGVSLYPVRIGALVCGLFGFLALLLAAVGLYGVIAFSVGQRKRELAVRLAMGADGSDIRKLVLGSGLRLVAVGTVLGTVLAALGSNALSGVLFDVSPLDPIAFGGAILIIVGISVIANLVPAVRASKTDPQIVLRQE